MIAVLLEVAYGQRLTGLIGGAAPMPDKLTVCVGASSLMLTGLRRSSVGGSFTAATVTVNVCTIVLFVP